MKHLLILPVAIFAAACAQESAQERFILDGVPSPAFQFDLTACERLAENQKQFDQQTWRAVALGAGTGALLGEVSDDDDPLGGAIVGALAGGAAGAVNASERREEIVRACLRGRGHPVVG